MQKTLVFLLLLWLPSAFAEQTEIGGGLTRPGDYMGQILISLVLVLLIIFFAAWLLRRYGRFSAVADGNLKVLGMLSVGQRERILLLQVGDKQLLVGVTTSRITTLHELQEPVEMKADRAEASLSPSFYQRLQDALKQRQSSETP